MQESLDVHGLANKPLKRLAAGILEKEQSPTALAHQIHRPDSPGRIKLILQGVFLDEPVKNGRRGLLRIGDGNQNRLKAAALLAAPSVERILRVLPQDLEIS